MLLAYLADAVGFVHHEESHLDALKGVHETLVVKPLRRHVKQSNTARTDLQPTETASNEEK